MSIYKKDKPRKRRCGEQTDRDSSVAITYAISSVLIEHNRLNWCSLSGLLLNRGINPSTSLKCMVTDCGKLLSASLFAYLPPILLPIYLVGKLLSGVSSPVTVDKIMFYKELNNVWRLILKDGLGLQRHDRKQISTWSSSCQEQSLWVLVNLLQGKTKLQLSSCQHQSRHNFPQL